MKIARLSLTIRLLAAASLAVVSWAAECTPVHGPRILGRDLNLVHPGLVSVKDDEVIATTPEPGLERRLTAFEERHFGVALAGLCFCRATALLKVADLEKALRSVLAGRAATVEVIDFSRVPVPEGSIQFTLSGITKPSQAGSESSPVMWRGRLVYDTARSIPIWVQARILEKRRWVESVMSLSRGVIVSPEQLAQKTGDRFPLAVVSVGDPAAFVGRIPRRTIPAGRTLTSEMFDDPPLISRGESVTVEVLSGTVSLTYEARAETGGKLNDFILVRDNESGRKNQARVAAKGKVVVDANLHAHRSVPINDGPERVR